MEMFIPRKTVSKTSRHISNQSANNNNNNNLSRNKSNKVTKNVCIFPLFFLFWERRPSHCYVQKGCCLFRCLNIRTSTTKEIFWASSEKPSRPSGFTICRDLYFVSSRQWQKPGKHHVFVFTFCVLNLPCIF